MATGNVLVKIGRETKRIRKAHPGMSFRAAQKKATSAYHHGTLGGTKKRRAKRAKPHKKKHTAKRKSAPKRKSRKRMTRTVVVVAGTHPKRKRRRSRPRYKVSHKVRRVRGTGGGGIKTKDLLLFGGIAIGGYLLYKSMNKATSTITPVTGAPPLVLTSNQQRNDQSQQIIAWATAGGMALDAITRLIQSLNTKSDSQVSSISASIANGSGVPGWALI